MALPPGFPVFARVCDAARHLLGGGVLLFPTETFYALGCLASQTEAVARVYQLKGRPVQQPLPLLAANAAQAAQVARLEGNDARLAARFWPGPLSLLLPVRAGGQPALAPQLVNAGGKLAVRVSPHCLAACLAQGAGGVLTASSANLRGQPPARTAAELDMALLTAVAAAGGGLLAPRSAAEQPGGGLPSTLAECLPDGRVRLLRQGAVSAALLTAAGWRVEYE